MVNHIVFSDLPSHYGEKVISSELKETKTEILITPISEKPNTVLLAISGHTYNDHGKDIEIEFAVEPSAVALALDFSKGTRAFE